MIESQPYRGTPGAAKQGWLSRAITQNNGAPKAIYSMAPTQNIDLNCSRFRAKFGPEALSMD
jgi:hypothetical protein